MAARLVRLVVTMDVVVVGSCNTDLISYVERLPKPGETIRGKKFSIGFGGKGANQCIAAARLGAKTAMVAKVGEDDFGHNYIQNFKDNHISVDYIGQTSEAATGVTPITVDDSGQNSIMIIPGANLLLSEADIQQVVPLLQKAKLLLCQLEIAPETTLAALKLAKAHGVQTILNPAPALPSLDADMYRACDIFCPNETEAEMLTGQPVTSMEEASAAIQTLLGRGCRMVVITLGERGAMFASQDDPNPKHVPATPVTPVDTTGAGDAFVGGLAFYLSHHPQLGLEESIRRAGEIATVSVQAPGTQTSFPWRKDLPDRLFTS